MNDKIESKAWFWRTWAKRLGYKAEKRRIALENLDAAIDLTRQDGRLPLIREARDAYMSALNPVDKKKVAT